MFGDKKKGYYGTKYVLACVFRTWAMITVLSIFITKATQITKNLLINMDDFTNIFSIIGAVFLFLKFRTIKINNKTLTKIITYVSASTFSIYIIHENVNNRFLWGEVFNKLPNHWNLGVLVSYIFIASAIVFVICLLIDFLRRLIIYLIRKIPQVNSIFTKTAKKLDNINEKINKFIEPKEENKIVKV